MQSPFGSTYFSYCSRFLWGMWIHFAARQRGVRCVSGVRGPKGLRTARSTPQGSRRRQEQGTAQEGGRPQGRPPPEGKPEESEGRRRARSVPESGEPQARGRGERRQAGEERGPQRERGRLRPGDVTGPSGALSHFAHASGVSEDLPVRGCLHGMCIACHTLEKEPPNSP